MNRYNRKNKTILLFIIIILIANLAAFFYVKGCLISSEPIIKLFLHEKNKIIVLPLEEYIIGAVAAEMPAAFELEALKAQAVCARTYALRKILDQNAYPLNADLSDDCNQCQAYINKQEFVQKHPHKSKSYWEKIKKAVQETRGEIMLYNNYPIDALYHSTCGGRTAAAKDVWGTEIAYLQSVKCDYCQSSAYYKKKYTFSDNEIAQYFGKPVGGTSIFIIKRASCGRCQAININGEIYNADVVRSKLKLPSTWMTINKKDQKIIITTHGYGHGVGMCQYGANGIAQKGYDYHQILHKYYQEIDFYKIDY